MNGRKESGLTGEEIYSVLEAQKFLCALTGTPLTCNLKRGTITNTNASIDRIEAGGPYTKDNIQMVCSVVNGLRSNLTSDEFIDWCRKVVDYADREKT